MELDKQLAQSRDRITDILTRNRPSMQDISTSFLNAVTGSRTYGEEMNAIKAAKLGEQKTLFDVLSGHKKIKQADRQLGQDEQASAWKKIQDLRKQGVDDANAIGESIERYVVNDADRATVANYLESLPDEINAINADQMTARAVSDLARQGKIKQTKPESSSNSMYKVKDDASPTGWSYMGQGGRKITGAAPPGGGMSITVDKDGNTVVQTGPMTSAQSGKRTAEALDAKDKASAAIAEAETALKKVLKNPNAVGVLGEGIETFGGLIEQIPVLGDATGEWLGTAEVQKTRTQLKSLIGKFVGAVTGDTSGRFSDRDMQLVSVVTQANSPTASVQQVTAALEAIIEISHRDRARADMKLNNIPDLTSRIGMREYHRRLASEHPDWSDEQIIQFIVDKLDEFGVPVAN